MKSGLEDRNNSRRTTTATAKNRSLNEVRPGRPEQSRFADLEDAGNLRVSMKSGLEDRNNPAKARELELVGIVSMKSGLEDRNNRPRSVLGRRPPSRSQ